MRYLAVYQGLNPEVVWWPGTHQSTRLRLQQRQASSAKFLGAGLKSNPSTHDRSTWLCLTSWQSVTAERGLGLAALWPQPEVV